jgi:hypothetical protein
MRAFRRVLIPLTLSLGLLLLALGVLQGAMLQVMAGLVVPAGLGVWVPLGAVKVWQV